MGVSRDERGVDTARLRRAGLRVTAPRLAILAMLEEVGGHRAVDELVLVLHDAGYHHARTTVYNALEDLARAGLVRAAPVDAGALRYETATDPHHHFVCRRCGLIRNVAIADDLIGREAPDIDGATVQEIDVVYRGTCGPCAQEVAGGAPESIGTRRAEGSANGEGGTLHNLREHREPVFPAAAAGTR